MAEPIHPRLAHSLQVHDVGPVDADAGWALSSVYMRAMLLKPRMSPERMRFPASQFRGLSASGEERRAMTARHTDWIVQAGVHASSFKMSRHISPVLKRTLGWKTRVMKRTCGGASG
eukprot:CAMPEP_0206053770 /NCGR_PEP_ID=MMETSP1466-20131121/36551_1 /ASSEMBLY_ACC=CAM_ASM_001126 /TAXON_ID=44452 /ORGANISM="Pavlova gyrans, Strain CCMP608" /LENGTH=116 /DNA_ID=CAMNT_0053428953 /DNA_START=137 /DNA_END=488 /DNA_ORIENTATION=+